MAIPQTYSSTQIPAGDENLSAWRNVLTPLLTTLRQMAGTTEDEFLLIGSRMQSFYQCSMDISRMANQLVEVVSGERLQMLISRLQQIMTEMEQYLADSRLSSNESCTTLLRVQELLEEVTHPLQGFQKMNKTLRMLSISTRIESSRLGEMGNGFVNLAMDVEKLSHQVNDKSAAILAQRQILASMITSTLTAVQASEKAQDSQLCISTAATADNLQELIAVNERCSNFGSTVSAVSSDVIADIGEVVASQQVHDITRQQVEHVVEALERLIDNLNSADSEALTDERRRKLVIEVGDVCELQEAQLRFAASELYTAVCTIMENLRDVASKQNTIAQETMAVTGAAEAEGSSFVDNLKQGIMSVTTVLTSCARTDQDMAVTLQNVAGTIQQITSFVSDIEDIGTEIDLIALNSQIKAAHTGREGAALGVLAEAIKRLSDEAGKQTELVSSALSSILTSTDHLSAESSAEESGSATRISTMESELSKILPTLSAMNSDLFSLLASLSEKIQSLTMDIEQAIAEIDVHERTKGMSKNVLDALERVVSQARKIEPASNEFKQNLRHMEQSYTMESERHIHDAIARKRSGQLAVTEKAEVKNSSQSDSEFGDNVDLF